MPELYDLVEKYNPDIVWSDGCWEATSDNWKAKKFLAWLATDSSVKDTVVWNDRWGTDTKCKHGSFLTCTDRYIPNSTTSEKYETCMTLDKTAWVHSRKSNLEDYLTTKELVDTVVKTISRNGNILINVGPGADGTISPIMADRLIGLGDWLMVNGQAIYKSHPWGICNQDLNLNVFNSRDEKLLYVHLTKWPSDNQVPLSCPQISESTRAFILGLGPAEDEKVGNEGSNEGGVLVRSNMGYLAKSKTRALLPSITLELPNLNPITSLASMFGSSL